MKREIVLALDIFTNDGVSISYYCQIPGLKEGYMFLQLGSISQEEAFWQGLYQALKALGNFRNTTTIKFGFSELLLTLNGKYFKSKAISMIDQFECVVHIDKEPFQDALSQMNVIGNRKQIEVGTLFGLNVEEFNNEINNDVKKEIKPKKIQYYQGIKKPNRGVVIDFESTSQITRYSRIIEISALKFENDVIVSEFTTLVNPGMKLPKKIRELTGITQKEVDAAPNSFQAVKELLSFMKDVDVFVAHNAAYDYALLDNFCTRFKFPKWKGKILCTYRLAKQAQLDTPNHKLGTLCELFAIENPEAHRARSDALATFNLLKALYSDRLF